MAVREHLTQKDHSEYVVTEEGGTVQHITKKLLVFLDKNNSPEIWDKIWRVLLHGHMKRDLPADYETIAILPH